MSDLETFGNYVRKVRKRRKIGIRKAASQAGVTPSTFSRIENYQECVFSTAMAVYRWTKAAPPPEDHSTANENQT